MKVPARDQKSIIFMLVLTCINFLPITLSSVINSVSCLHPQSYIDRNRNDLIVVSDGQVVWNKSNYLGNNISFVGFSKYVGYQLIKINNVLFKSFLGLTFRNIFIRKIWRLLFAALVLLQNGLFQWPRRQMLAQLQKARWYSLWVKLNSLLKRSSNPQFTHSKSFAPLYYVITLGLLV